MTQLLTCLNTDCTRCPDQHQSLRPMGVTLIWFTLPVCPFSSFLKDIDESIFSLIVTRKWAVEWKRRDAVDKVEFEEDKCSQRTWKYYWKKSFYLVNQCLQTRSPMSVGSKYATMLRSHYSSCICWDNLIFYAEQPRQWVALRHYYSCNFDQLLPPLLSAVMLNSGAFYLWYSVVFFCVFYYCYVMEHCVISPDKLPKTVPK